MNKTSISFPNVLNRISLLSLSNFCLNKCEKLILISGSKKMQVIAF